MEICLTTPDFNYILALVQVGSKIFFFRQRITLILISLVFFALAFLVFAAYSSKLQQISSYSSSSLDSTAKVNSQLIASPLENTLILGLDSQVARKLTGWRGRTDVIMLASFNHLSNKLSVLSIPRDTFVDFEASKVTRINSANAVDGYKLTKSMVEKLTGLDINHVVVFNLAGFKEIMSKVGSTKILINKGMHYDDNRADLHIDFDPGLHEMNSQDLVEFLRYRDNFDGDIGRIKRQHLFLRSLVKAVDIRKLISKLPEILQKSGELLLTDMNYSNVLSLVSKIYPAINNGFDSYILPGDFGRDGYWIVDQPRANKIIKHIKAAPEPRGTET